MDAPKEKVTLFNGVHLGKISYEYFRLILEEFNVLDSDRSFFGGERVPYKWDDNEKHKLD